MAIFWIFPYVKTRQTTETHISSQLEFDTKIICKMYNILPSQWSQPLFEKIALDYQVSKIADIFGSII